MAFETLTAEPLDTDPFVEEPGYLQWTPVVAGALAATALSFIMVTFAAAVGLGVSSTAPTWRDASVALWLLAGVYLLLQAVLGFGFGGLVAVRVPEPLLEVADDDVENGEGLHGLTVWALAVVLGAGLAAMVGAA